MRTNSCWVRSPAGDDQAVVAVRDKADKPLNAGKEEEIAEDLEPAIALPDD